MAQLSIDTDWLTSADGVAMLAGNAIPEGAEPIAQAYAGHQFGGFSPQLGDGRALLGGGKIPNPQDSQPPIDLLKSSDLDSLK